MSRPALLVMDVQRGIVDRYPEETAPLLVALEKAIIAARAADVPVIFVRVAFRTNYPEINPSNRTFSALAAAGGLAEGDQSTQIHPALRPHPADLVVTKKRVSAFTGSDLEVLLRSLEVDGLVLSGIATSGVVLSTLRQAADLDFQLTVLRDGCADADPEVHRVLLDKIFPRQAKVISTDGWIQNLAAAVSVD